MTTTGPSPHPPSTPGHDAGRGVEVVFVPALEQLPPAEAVEVAAIAGRAGFDGTAVVDRFQPWTPGQGEASFGWNVLSAIGQRGGGTLTMTAVPTSRMHPAAVAQASATLDALYPGRHRLVLAPGNAIDEHVVGGYWPESAERMERLFDAGELIRKLFHASASGHDTRHTGPFFRLETSRLWTMPNTSPPILVWAAGPVSAKRAGRAVDGIATGGARPDKLELLLARFAEGARQVGRDPHLSPKVLHVHLSWARTDDEALRNVRSGWPTAGVAFPHSDVRSPFEVERMVRALPPDAGSGQLLASADPDLHRAHIQRMLDVGFTSVHLHNVGPNQREWIEVFSRDVLPALHR